MIPANDPENCNRKGGTFYIAVYGTSFLMECTYTLTVIFEGGTTTVIPGVSVDGQIFRGLGKLYQYNVGTEAEEVAITLTPHDGDPDIYVKMNKDATYNNYDYRSNKIGSFVDQVIIPENEICTNCYVSILVYGFDSATFSLSISLNDTVVTLLENIPQKAAVTQSTYQYYKLKASQAGSVEVVLTVFSGQPLIYMSLTEVHPSSTSINTIHSDSYFSGNLPIVTLAGVNAGDNVYISVSGDALFNATYSIRASMYSDNSISLYKLLVSLPQTDSIPYSLTKVWKYYQFRVQPGHETVNIVCTNIVGEVDVYVTKCSSPDASKCLAPISSLPNETYYLYTTRNKEQDSLQIPRDDKDQLSYIIGVKSLSHYVAYQISAALTGNMMQLQPGVSVTDHVERNEIDYYAFNFDQDEEVLKLDITTISGDPDIYVSTKNQRPTTSNYTWRSYKFGGDMVEIDPNFDPLACSHCMYYIGVVGTSASTYTITASLLSTISHLSDGQPYGGTVNPLAYSYYVFSNVYGTSRDLKIQISVATGSVDFYVTLDGTKPTWLHYTYANIGDTIDILHNDEKYTPCLPTLSQSSSSQCQILIAVHGKSMYQSSYVITLTSSLSATLLQMDMPKRGSVAFGSSANYRLKLNKQSTNIHLSLTEYSGHVQAYVSCDTDSSIENGDSKNSSFPSKNNNLWSFSDSIDIPVVDIAGKGCFQSNSWANIFISVQPSSSAGIQTNTSASFSILATTSDESFMPQLLPGTPLSETVHYHDMSLFYVRPAESYDDVKITATILSGNVDIYVSNSWDSRPYFSAKTGKVESYSLSGVSISSSTKEILVSHDFMQSLCTDEEYCYIVVGVFGIYNDPTTPSSYRLVSSLIDSTIILGDGVPFHGRSSKDQYQYYHFMNVHPLTDLVVSVTPVNGDPDVYISEAPNTHPSRTNFTWVSASLGADVMTIQSESLSCRPVESSSAPCDVYIGVYGWQNTTYIITVSSDSGFASPATLIDGQPQNDAVDHGKYKYYQFTVTGRVSGSALSITDAITFTLTPTEGDVDLYVYFSRHSTDGHPNDEPGKENYDYKSSQWASLTEEITISSDMDMFCINCVVYVAVFGYSQSRYSITATSKSLSMLVPGQAIGGLVDKSAYKYYSYYNSDPYAEINVILTIISGDADLYVLPYSDGETNVYPTREKYNWHSLHVGDDNLRISYLDKHFCYDCGYVIIIIIIAITIIIIMIITRYVIGVYGYRNSSYTLLVTESEASIIQLADNRPQMMTLTQDKKKYFSTEIHTSADDVMISLSPLGTGWADIYANVYNMTDYESAGGGDLILPSPDDPTSYLYTTANTENDFINIPGPYNYDVVIIVTVYARTNIKFSIVSSHSQRPITLQAGIPQSHFVTSQSMEYFQYIPSDSAEDLRISLSSKSGDPDLFIGSGIYNPVCHYIPENFTTACTNFTWMSGQFSTDQIFISSDFPCSAVISSTHVSKLCDPVTSYLPGTGQPINIGVYGFETSKFIIMVAPSGQHVNLVAGVPQQSTTSVGYECLKRSDNGACLPEVADSAKQVQVAYFSFIVSEPGDVALTLMPKCDSAASQTSINMVNRLASTCEPGCNCDPLIVYVRSCRKDKCNSINSYPSSLFGQNSLAYTVSQSGSTIFLSVDTVSTSRAGPVYCLPTDEIPCEYYFAVTRKHASGSLDLTHAAQFSITARTPGDVALISCPSTETPDGVRQPIVDKITADGVNKNRYYELCANYDSDLGPERIIISLEQCSGSTNIYACDDDDHCDNALPSDNSWAYYADSEQVCTRAWSPSLNVLGNPKCIDRETNSNDAISIALSFSKTPFFTLTQREAGNYFLMTSGSGKYILNTYSTMKGQEITPILVQDGVQKSGAGRKITISKQEGNTITIEWAPVRVLMPGAQSAVLAAFMRYTAYIVDTDVLYSHTFKSKLDENSPILTTACGLDFITKQYPEAAYEESMVINEDTNLNTNGTLSYKIKNLPTSSNVALIIVARCEGDCFSIISKSTNLKSTIDCGKGATCKTQTYVYEQVTLTTGIYIFIYLLILSLS